ncbi:uncharacterized protein L969DRAFT_49616 [Mixia osmundae IAM 14324]|uniref:Uncharacterized protein n=1 Tax=Mixia osmundae (strain CBS 9802 / IAM 14324 / JCM 22182 / KY 12970) TaxID=764103 RepID=G7E8F5_MIXOS|nr:uncharacterized protein L969DRAFT_49616 [Mixia osmundae IAM 14324]KEI39216.1 hypothetical protein L969DRAFT_49616 [Mixia osmundae IAM 14324]GAA99115.1 hypothetical protein E5Q_05804 [Mixia osmundae IAM 14324]
MLVPKWLLVTCATLVSCVPTANLPALAHESSLQPSSSIARRDFGMIYQLHFLLMGECDNVGAFGSTEPTANLLIHGPAHGLPAGGERIWGDGFEEVTFEEKANGLVRVNLLYKGSRRNYPEESWTEDRLWCCSVNGTASFDASYTSREILDLEMDIIGRCTPDSWQCKGKTGIPATTKCTVKAGYLTSNGIHIGRSSSKGV